MKRIKIWKINIVLLVIAALINTATSVLFFNQGRTGIGIGFGIAAFCFIMSFIFGITSFTGETNED